eukprot:sb/3479008/
MTNFPRYRKLTVFHPDIPGTPIYRAKSFPPRVPVNRGPTVSCHDYHLVGLLTIFLHTVGPRFSDPRFSGHPDLVPKTLSPEDVTKSGSDCIYIDAI